MFITTQSHDRLGWPSVRAVRQKEADGFAREDSPAQKLLAPWEIAELARDQDLPRRNLRIRVRAALREWLGEVSGIIAAKIALKRLPSGRLELDETPARWTFSVSTRGDLGLIALGRAEDGEVGVDVESNADSAVAALSAPAFTAAERAKLDTLPSSARTAAALRLWVRKEAVAKALGLGVAAFDAGLDLSALNLAENHDGKTIQFCGRAVRVRDISVAEGYTAAVAVAAPKRI
jgi:4'-phosphopantetheinyl transferase